MGTLSALMLLVPFASQAEAAETLAHSLAELIRPDVIEPGDANDSGLGEISVRAETPSDVDLSPFFSPAFEGLTLTGRHALAGFTATVRLCEDPPWPSHRRAHRLASIQTFLC